MCYIRVRTAKDIETIANGNCGGRVLLEFLRDKIGLTAKDPEMDLADDGGNLLFLTKLSPTCNVLQVLNPRALYFPVLITEKPELKLEVRTSLGVDSKGRYCWCFVLKYDKKRV